jgi:hypothetical protein
LDDFGEDVENTTDYNFENFTAALNKIVIEQQDFFDWLDVVSDYIGIFNDDAGEVSGLMVKAMKKVFAVISFEG